jgi:hypothetical protein
MHREIRQHNKRTPVDTKTNTIPPQRLDVESKRAQDGGARDFNVEAVFVVDEGEVFDFVYDEAFEGVVEYR